MDNKALFKVKYGLYLVSTNEVKDNICVINTFMQVTSTPLQVSLCINNANYTTEILKKTKKANVMGIALDAPFSIFERFGFQSGKNVYKLEGFANYSRSENGLVYLNSYVNSLFSLTVKNIIELGSHTLFICEVDDMKVLSELPTLSYDDYHNNVKPKPTTSKSVSYRCSVCGFVYEGDDIPDDYICPICKHGREVFERIEN